MRMRSKYFIIAVACSAVLTGCNGSYGSSYNNDTVAMQSTMGVETEDGFYSGMSTYDSYDMAEEEYVADDSFGGYDDDSSFTYSGDEEIVEPEEPSTKVNKDMLIYRGSVSLTTKEFSKDLQYLKSLLTSYDCFFENESKWTEKSYDDRTISHYDATVRVASSQYNALLDGMNEICTVENLTSSCENVSAEYTDTVVAIDIYEAERDRYINMLSTIMDDQYALEVQRELTDIELKLAQYRARKQNIETDVSYSYVSISLSEVREYEQQTEYNDSFVKRLWDTVVNTFFGFLHVLESLLFFCIRISPYAILIFILSKILKKTGLGSKVDNISIVKRIKDKYSTFRENSRKDKERKIERRKAIQEMNEFYKDATGSVSGGSTDSSTESDTSENK